MNNDLKPNESQKLIMRENLTSPLNKEKARRLVLNNQNIKNDHVFDKLILLGIPEETNDKSNNYNSNINLINDSVGDMNQLGKNPKKPFEPESNNSKRKVNFMDLSSKENIVTITYNKNVNKNINNNYFNNISKNYDFNKENNKNNLNLEENNAVYASNIQKKDNFSLQPMQQNNQINKSYNMENLFFKNNSSSNFNINNIKNQSANSNSNIYIRNNNINLNSFAGESRLSKIYKEDSFNSKKTLEIIKQRKSSLIIKKNQIPEAFSAKKSLSPYFQTFKEFFSDEKIIKQKLKEIFKMLNENKFLEKIKINFNILDDSNGNGDGNVNISGESRNENSNCENKKGKNAKIDVDKNIHTKKNNKKLKDLSDASNKNNNNTDFETTGSNEHDKIGKTNNLRINSNENDNPSKKSEEDIKKAIGKNAIKRNSNRNLIKNDFQDPTINENNNKTRDNNKNNKINILSYNNNNNKSSNSNYNYFSKNPIGPICEMEKIYFLCQLKNAKSEITKISKDLAYWRLILGDGNCFYRAFVFSLIELWILQSNISNLKKLLCDFFSVSETEKNNLLIKQNPFNEKETGAILALVLQQLKKNNKRKAYEIFLKAFQNSKSFDIGLIVYMRLILFNYISKHKNFYYNLESQIELGHLLPNEYIDDFGNFQFEDFFNCFLLRMNSEAEKIIIYLSPIIFGVDLDLFILEGLAKAKCSGFNNNNSWKDFRETVKESEFNKNNNFGNNIKNGDLINDNYNNYLNNNNNNCNYNYNNASEIKLLREHFPCYHEEVLNQENKEDDTNSSNYHNNNFKNIDNSKNSEHPSSRNKKGKLHESIKESSNLNNYFNSKMLMTIRENDDLFENNNEEKEAEILLNDINNNNEENEKPLTYNNNLNQDNINNINNNYNNNDKNSINLSNLSYEKKEINENKNLKTFNTISLLYRSAHYDKVYTKAFTEQFNNFDFKNSDYFIFNSAKEDLFAERKINVEESFCAKCDKNVKKISFKHLKEFGFVYCKICLMEIISNVFKQRVKSFVEENYNNLEYYCRPIKIDDEKDLELYDQDIMSLYRESIHQHFIRLIEKTCLNCFNKYDDFNSDFVFFNCRCKMCKFCVVDKIKNLTQGKFILNNFEKRKIISTFYIDCICFNKIEVNYALHNTLDDSELLFWEGKATKRFKEVIKRHCLNCKNLIKIKSEKKKKSKEINSEKNKINNSHKNKNNLNKINNNNNNNNNTLEEKELNNNSNNLNNNQKLNFNILQCENDSPDEEEKEKEYNLAYNKNSYVKYYNFPIIQQQNKIENPIEESFDPHLICDLCVDIVNQEILNKIRLRSQKGKREVVRFAEIKCILCLKEHQVEYKNFKKFIKTGFQRCCNVL